MLVGPSARTSTPGPEANRSQPSRQASHNTPKRGSTPMFQCTFCRKSINVLTRRAGRDMNNPNTSPTRSGSAWQMLYRQPLACLVKQTWNIVCSVANAPSQAQCTSAQNSEGDKSAFRGRKLIVRSKDATIFTSILRLSIAPRPCYRRPTSGKRKPKWSIKHGNAASAVSS